MDNPIHFFSEDIQFELTDQPRFIEWIQEVVESFKQSILDVNYIYCSDKYLLDINKEYLDHDYFTDIITFDNREDKTQPLEADIFISIDRVRENADLLNQSFTIELARVMIHGIHHLLGQGDKTEAEKAEMRKREEASLSLLKI